MHDKKINFAHNRQPIEWKTKINYSRKINRKIDIHDWQTTIRFRVCLFKSNLFPMFVRKLSLHKIILMSNVWAELSHHCGFFYAVCFLKLDNRTKAKAKSENANSTRIATYIANNDEWNNFLKLSTIINHNNISDSPLN